MTRRDFFTKHAVAFRYDPKHDIIQIDISSTETIRAHLSRDLAMSNADVLWLYVDQMIVRMAREQGYDIPEIRSI
jgi:hypothetical protein